MTEKLMSQKTGARNGRRLNWSDRIRNFVGRSLKAALPGVAIALASQVQTQADITFKVEQVGPDVVFTATGSINTVQLFANGWTQNTSQWYAGFVEVGSPASAFSRIGFIASSGQQNILRAGTITSPSDLTDYPSISSFGGGGSVTAENIALTKNFGPIDLLLPVNYVSGTAITPQSETFQGTVLSGSNRSYIWTLPGSQKITVEVYPPLDLNSPPPPRLTAPRPRATRWTSRRPSVRTPRAWIRRISL